MSALFGFSKPRALVPLRPSGWRAYRGAGRLAAGDHDQRSKAAPQSTPQVAVISCRK